MKQIKQHLKYINNIFNEVTEDSLKYHSSKEAFRYACKLIEIDARKCQRNVRKQIDYFIRISILIGVIFVLLTSLFFLI